MSRERAKNLITSVCFVRRGSGLGMRATNVTGTSEESHYFCMYRNNIIFGRKVFVRPTLWRIPIIMQYRQTVELTNIRSDMHHQCFKKNIISSVIRSEAGERRREKDKGQRGGSRQTDRQTRPICGYDCVTAIGVGSNLKESRSRLRIIMQQGVARLILSQIALVSRQTRHIIMCFVP